MVAAGLAVVAAAAAYLRLTGIAWGAPYAYHPDEHFIVHRALDIVRTGDLDPHWFQYPSLWIYAEALLVAAVRLFSAAPLETNYAVNGIGPWDVLPEQWPFVLAGRVAVALAGTAGIACLGAAGARLFGAPVGLAAAAFVMAAPLHAESSHYLTTDVPSGALVAATLWAAAARRPRWLLAGLLAGLAAGTKYTAGVALFAAAALAWAGQEPRAVAARWARLGGGFLLGFALATPYAILDAPAFWQGIAAQRRNYLGGAGNLGSNLCWYAEYAYRTGLGPVAALLIGLGVVRLAAELVSGARARQPVGKIGAILLPLLYLPWLAWYPARAERNLVVVLPFLALIAAEFLHRVASLVRHPRWARGLFAALVALALASSLPLVAEQNRDFRKADTRTLALRWIEEHLPRGSRIAREEYTPQVRSHRYEVMYGWSLARWPYDWYVANEVEFLVASSSVYGRVLGPPHLGGEGAAAFYRLIFGLPRLAEFRPGPHARGPVILIFRVPLAR